MPSRRLGWCTAKCAEEVQLCFPQPQRSTPLRTSDGLGWSELALAGPDLDTQIHKFFLPGAPGLVWTGPGWPGLAWAGLGGVPNASWPKPAICDIS